MIYCEEKKSLYGNRLKDDLKVEIRSHLNFSFKTF